MNYPLLCFGNPKPAFKLTVNVERNPPSGKKLTSLSLSYYLEGDLAKLILPDRLSNPQRKDKLYQHSCFEFFARSKEPQTERYLEWNFSPSGEWQWYAFTGYRNCLEGEFSSRNNAFSKWDCLRKLNSLELHLEIPAIAFDWLGKEPFQLGLATVLEHADGALSYWANIHVEDKPNFHHPGSFLILV